MSSLIDRCSRGTALPQTRNKWFRSPNRISSTVPKAMATTALREDLWTTSAGLSKRTQRSVTHMKPWTISLHRRSHLSLAKIKNDLSLLYKIFLIKYFWLHESKLEMSNYKQYYSYKWFKTDFEIFNDKYLNLNEK